MTAACMLCMTIHPLLTQQHGDGPQEPSWGAVALTPAEARTVVQSTCAPDYGRPFAGDDNGVMESTRLDTSFAGAGALAGATARHHDFHASVFVCPAQQGMLALTATSVTAHVYSS